MKFPQKNAKITQIEGKVKKKSNKPEREMVVHAIHSEAIKSRRNGKNLLKFHVVLIRPRLNSYRVKESRLKKLRSEGFRERKQKNIESERDYKRRWKKLTLVKDIKNPKLINVIIIIKLLNTNDQIRLVINIQIFVLVLEMNLDTLNYI